MVDDEELVAMKVLLDEQRDARDERDLDRVRAIAVTARANMEHWPEEMKYPFETSICYEEAMVFSIEDDLEQCAEKFREVGEWAAKAGEKVRPQVGRFRYAFTSYLADTMPTRAAYDAICDVYAAYEVLESEGKSSEIANVKLNALKRLTELSFELGDADFDRWSKLLMETDALGGGKGLSGAALEASLEPMHSLLHRQVIAREFLMDGLVEPAISLLAAYLDVDIGLPQPSGAEGKRLASLRGFAHARAEELSRDYRDLGRALMCSDRPDKVVLARKVWRRGLEVPSGNGNRKYQKDIRADLAALDD